MPHSPPHGLPRKGAPVSFMAAATFQEGKSQSSSARGSACIMLLLSHWPKQVTQPSPELLWARPIQGHGFQEAWFVGAMMSLSICHRNGPGFPSAFPALVSGILSFLGHLTWEGSAQRRIGAGDIKKTQEPAQRGPGGQFRDCWSIRRMTASFCKLSNKSKLVNPHWWGKLTAERCSATEK